MNFLHPWLFAGGLAAIALPVAIHYLTKPRPRRMPLSTIRFVQQAVKQKRARYRLRDFLILLLRTVAVMLLAWAFSRPTTGAKPLVSANTSGDAVRVVILDSSLSMSAVAGGQSAFDRARASAAQYLQFQPGLRCDLILAAAKSRATIGTASANFAGLRDALADAHPLSERLDIQSAINRAAEILAKSSRSAAARAELVIFSDFQRNNWAQADFAPISKDVLIQFESVAPQQPLQNLGIVKVTGVGRIEQGRECRIEVEIGNYSKTPREVQVELTAGELSCQLHGLCPAGVKTTLTGTVVPTTMGWLAGKVRIVGSMDALAEDDQRYFTLDVRPAPTYALLTRESGNPHVSSSHFLERALVPIKLKEGQSGERVQRLNPMQLDREALGSADLLVLDHPGKISNETINTLAGMIRRGKGMLYVAAEQIDATNLKLIADAAGSDLKMPVEFQPTPANASRNDLFLASWTKDQSLFSQFGETMSAVAGGLRFSGGLSSRRLESGLLDDVLATYSDRSACLVVSSFGAGSLAVLNADLLQSNLPSSPIFVPMIGEICGRLLATNSGSEAIATGEPMAVYLPSQLTSADGLTVVNTKGETVADAKISQEGNFILWRSDSAAAPGVYKVQKGNLPVFAVATAAPGSESDLESLNPDTLKTRLAGGRSVYFKSAGDEPPKDQHWAWILFVCSICLAGELGVLTVFKT